MSHSLKNNSCTRRDLGDSDSDSDSNESDNSKPFSTSCSSRAAPSSSNELNPGVISSRSESDNSTSDSNQDSSTSDSGNNAMFARAKQGKDVNTLMPMNSDGDEEEDVADLFFNFYNGKSSSVEETEKDEEDVGNSGLANDENDNNLSTLVLGAGAPSSPQIISKTDSDSSSNQSSDDSDGTTSEEKPSDENTAALYFARLAEARTSDKSDDTGSESNYDTSKKSAPTTNSFDGSIDNTAGRLFGSLGSDIDNSGSDSGCDSDLDDSSRVPAENMEIEPKQKTDDTNNDAVPAAFFADLAKATNSDNDDSSESDSDPDFNSDHSLEPSKATTKKIPNAIANDSPDSDSDSDDNREPSEAITKKGPKVSADVSPDSDSDSDDNREPSEAITKKGPKVSADVSPDSDSDSDSDDSLDTSEAITKKGPKYQKYGVVEGAASVFVQPEKASNSDNNDSSGSDSDSGSHYGSKPSEYVLKKEEPKNDNNAGTFFTDLVKARNSGHDDSSDSDCDSECSSKISKSIEHKELRKQTGDGSTNCLENFVSAGNNDQGTDGSDHDSDVDDNVDAMKSVSKNASSKESDAESFYNPESFFANISKARENLGSKRSKSDSGDSPKIQESKKSNMESIDDPESFFANILKARESIGSKHSKSDSGDSPKVQESKKSNMEYIDDPESFFANVSKEFRQPVVRAGRTPDQSDKQYRSNNSEDRILFLHEEMRKIGLSPNIMVHGDDATQMSGRTSLGEDSYLEDLLQQLKEREDEHREEIMEEALECFNGSGDPKSERLFIEILDKITRQKEDEFAKRDLKEDKCISNELNLREQRLKGKSSSGNPPKEQQQDNTKENPEAGRSLFAKTPKPDKQATRSMRQQKEKDKGTESTKNSLPDRSVLKRKGEKEATVCALARRNSGIERDRKNNAALPGTAESVYDVIPGAPLSSSSSSVSSSSSSSSEPSQLSINGIEDEYYYDEERAMMDRQAIRLLEQEADVSQQESNLTRKIMLASTCLCCFAFVLFLLLILDPLDRGTLLNKS